jgi:hypothetical protein
MSATITSLIGATCAFLALALHKTKCVAPIRYQALRAV